MAEEWVKLAAIAEKMGLQGDSLSNFLSQEQARLRDERTHNRERERAREAREASEQARSWSHDSRAWAK